MVRLEGAQSALAKFGVKFDIAHISRAYTSCFEQCREVRNSGLDVNFREQVSIFVNHIKPGLTKHIDSLIMEEISGDFAHSVIVHPHPDHEHA